MLSIVVPVHNISGRTESLMSWVPTAIVNRVHVILVHDESQDTTELELNVMIKTWQSEFVAKHNVNLQSPGLTRNYGLNLVSTPWFSFADADDVVRIENLLKLVNETQDANSLVGVGAYLAIDANSHKKELFAPPKGDPKKLALHLASRMGLWRFVFNTDQFLHQEFTHHRMAEDYLFLAILLNSASRIHVSSFEVYMYFYGGEQNLTSNRSVMIEMFDVLEAIRRITPESKFAENFKTFSLQKLSYSLLRNVRSRALICLLPRIIITLISHPIYALKLFKENFKKNGEPG